MGNYLRAYFLNSIFLFAAILFIVYGFFNLDFLKGNNIDEYTNNFCQSNSSSLICKNKYKKNKFIWVFVDGNAYDQLVLLKNKEKYGIPIIFRGKGEGYKHTSPLFSEMFSGVISRSIFYSELKTDHIFKQLYSANYSMNFLGMNHPVNKLCGVKTKTFKNRRILKEHEICSFCDFCNVTYNIEDSWCKNYYKTIINRDERLLPEISKEKIYSDLDKHFKNDNKDILENIDLNDCFKKSFIEFNGKESLVYYNTEIDKNNHLFTKDHIKTITEEYNTEIWLIKLMKWIDEHPDYALIVNSDHGGQKFYGEDDINNHGLDIEGNEAIIFIYTKEFKDNYNKLKLDNIYYNKLDPSSIISQIFENVNIPLQSSGISYPIGNDSLFRYVAYKSKEVQLINQLKTYIKKYPFYEEYLDNIINKLQNSEFHKIKEEEYDKYFNEKYSDKAINFIKDIQNEIIKTLNDKNKNVTLHVLLCCGIIIIYALYISYQIKDIYKIVKEEDENILRLFAYILIISIFFIHFIKYCFVFLSVYNRLIIGIFSTPFCILISKFFINFHYFENNNYKIIIFLSLLGIMSIIIHYSEFFILLKEFFSAIIKSRILKVCVLYPVLFLELNYNIKKNFFNMNICFFKIPLFYIIKIIYITYIILVFLFDISTDNYFTVHTPFNYFITIMIYVLFLIMIILAEYIIIYNISNNIEDKNYELLKILFFLFEFFLNDESTRLMILITFILFEFIFDYFYNNELKKINKIIASITIININEIFYLLTSRVYSFENSKLIFSRTIGYSNGSLGKFDTFMKVFYKIRFTTILAGYLLESNILGNKVFHRVDAYILRLILNMRCALNFIFFCYEFIYLKNNEDYITMMVFSGVDLSVFIFDFLNHLVIFINFGIINFFVKQKYTKIQQLLEFF